jgi:quinol monooxygenase YgiN
MIHVIADITVKQGQREAFVELFKALVPTVLAEDGCMAYGPTVDLDTGIEVQSASQANVVTILEQWETVDALRKHLGMPHMAAFRDSVAEIVEDLTIRVCQPV